MWSWRGDDFADFAGAQLLAGLRVDDFRDILVHEVHAGFLVAFVSDGAARLGHGIGLVGIDTVVFFESLPQRRRQHLAGEPGALDGEVLFKIMPHFLGPLDNGH